MVNNLKNAVYERLSALPPYQEGELVIVSKTIILNLIDSIPNNVLGELHAKILVGLGDDEFGEWVKIERQGLGLTRTALAEELQALGVKVHQPDISTIEGKTKRGKMTVARKMKIRTALLTLKNNSVTQGLPENDPDIQRE